MLWKSSGLVVVWAASVVWAADGHNEAISFQRKQLSKEFWSEGATYGDFNRDGKTDVAIGPYWYQGPDFEKKHEYYPNQPYEKDGNYFGSCDSKIDTDKNPKGPFPVTTYSDNFFGFTGDFNADGWTDILILGFPGRHTCWYENPGEKGGHWPRHLAFDVTDNESPGLHDLLGNGKPVLVCSSRGQYGYAQPNPANPFAIWRWTAITPVGNYQRFTHGLGVGDVNGDGRPDLLEKDGWWEQPAPGSNAEFWTKHAFPFSQQGGAQMCVADLNGDGRNDVVTSLAAHQYGLAWYENIAGQDGKIDFKKHLIIGEKPEDSPYGVVFSQLHAVALTDMNGDGLPDIVTGKRKWAHGLKGDPRPGDDAVLYWFQTVRKEGNVDFIPWQIDTNTGVGTQVVVADITGDKLPDIVVGNKLGAFVLLQQRRPVSQSEHLELQPKKIEKKKLTDSPESNSTAGHIPKSSSGKVLNFDFENGTLADWTPIGDAFQGQPIEGDTVASRRADMRSRHHGKHWIGGYERHGDGPQGTLTSVPFKITHPFASFLVAGGASPMTAVEIVLHDPGRRGDYVQFRVSGDESENLKRVVVDLSKQVGKQMFIRLVDRESGGWGHINFDDFRFHDKPPRADRSAEPPKVDSFAENGLSPEAAARAMTVPEGFKVTLFAGEPDIVQPIAFTIDDRGRLWVVEGLSYPRRQPEGKGKDRILIFEDSDGDGKFDNRTVFMEGLNLVSGIELGFGGVWIGAAPYLLFVPVDAKTDKPAGPPKILLDGWGYQDTHETLNAFNWGPDGWLYGCHGVFTHSRVGKPGTPDADRTPINAGVWRYHPARHKFEVFAHGTSNPWGVDWDDRGQCFITACVIPHLYHMIQGGRYLRQGGLHFNPFTYDDIKEICDHVHYVGPNPHGGNGRSDDAGGGHAHCGAMIYQGGAWPAEYHNKIFMGNVHGRRINVNTLEPRGSGYVGRRAPDFLKANDSYAQFINLRYGPDGNVYIIDWYDANRCHRNEVEAHDRGNGRIYKVTYTGGRAPARSPSLAELLRPLVNSKANIRDLNELSDFDLVALALGHRNEYFVRKARRILQERPAAQTAAALRLFQVQNRQAQTTELQSLRELWLTHAVQGSNGGSSSPAMAIDPSSNDLVKAWGIQLAFDCDRPSDELVDKAQALAAGKTSPMLRLYLAAAAQRIAPAIRSSLLATVLQHSEDNADHNLPLMYWYALEPLADLDASNALAVALGGKIEVVVRHLARKLGSTGEAGPINAVVKAIGGKADATQRRALLAGLREGLAGRRRLAMPESWPAAYAAVRSDGDAASNDTAKSLAVTFGDPAALASIRDTLFASSASIGEREAALATLLAAKDAELGPKLPTLLKEKPLAAAAIRAMAAFDDATHAGALLAAYPTLGPSERRDALNTLAARKASAHRLLDAIAAKSIPAKEVTADIVRQLRFLDDRSLEDRLNAVWGAVRDTPADKAKLIATYKSLAQKKHKSAADPLLGRAVFAKTCQQCHKLFGVGDSIGPELTGSNRVDLDYILSNVIDPSAIMAHEYRPTVFATNDGRVLTGLIREQTAAAYTIRTANETVVVPKAEVESTRLSDKSMMPDDQLKSMTDFEVRSLLAYLASPEQVPIRATPDNAQTFFNGKDLANWNGDMKYWSVDHGEIVGKSPGMKLNQFLVNELWIGDFRLEFEVRLRPNEGNSGVQFRSRRIEGTEMRGYQADIGKGWWGKLYEESARGMLVNKGGEQWVNQGEWNRYRLEAVGDRIQIWLNGKQTVDFRDSKGDRDGHIAVQIHSGPPMEVRFRNFKLEVLDGKGKH